MMLRASVDAALVRPAQRASGRVQVPGDKSISHRYALLGAIADGTTRITGYSSGADCAATLACLRALGVPIVTPARARVEITGRGLHGLSAAPEPVDAANSGTTMRLLAGLVAAHPFRTVIVGDASLTRRPMRRVIAPLTEMGATIQSDDGRPPLTIDGAPLQRHHLPAGRAERPGEEQRAAGRPARGGPHGRRRARGHTGSYGAGPDRVRRSASTATACRSRSSGGQRLHGPRP